MVYGRYNELVHGGFVMVYKPTNITGGPHPVRIYIYNIYFIFPSNGIM